MSALQVRAFAKEGAACDKYEDAVQCVLQWGLASAFASGLFFAGNFILSTGMDISACRQQAFLPLTCGLIQVAAVMGTAQLLYHPSEHAPMLSVCHCGAACTPEQQSACTCRPGAPLVAHAVVWHSPEL